MDDTEKQLEEWKYSMENARHFNDLLMRLRMLGLPIVITLAAGGFAASALDAEVVVQVWEVHIILLVIALLALIGIGSHTINKQRKKNLGKGELQFSPLEFVMWIVFFSILTIPLINAGMDLSESTSTYFSNQVGFTITTFALIGAVTLLIALYFMDRFYYYKLLIGSITRLTELEQSLGFRITCTTSECIPQKHSQVLVTLFYGIPGAILLALALMLLL